MKYEYMIITTKKNPLEIMEKYTEKGWECFSVVAEPNIANCCRELYFKRPIHKKVSWIGCIFSTKVE